MTQVTLYGIKDTWDGREWVMTVHTSSNGDEAYDFNPMSVARNMFMTPDRAHRDNVLRAESCGGTFTWMVPFEVQVEI